ncbi:MAG: RtcB family protein, partial [Candidatus Heimdallarchaeota archaeon]|nr:RtcB family protein [Candidatus Heimdallarchaeota archaeon]
MSVLDKPIHIFAENVDGKALDQFYSAMKEEFSVAGALMPDVHAGYSLPIGAVVATEGVVIPAWVGYDIG